MHPHTRTPPLSCLTVLRKFLGLSSSFFLLHTIIRPSELKMLNQLLSAYKTLFLYVQGLFIVDFTNESQSFLFLVLTNNFLWTECPLNPAILRTHRTVSSETEAENCPLNSAVTFTSLKREFFTDFLIINLSSRLVNFLGRPFLTVFSIRFSSFKRFITYCAIEWDKLTNLVMLQIDLPLPWCKIINF